MIDTKQATRVTEGGCSDQPESRGSRNATTTTAMWQGDRYINRNGKSATKQAKHCEDARNPRSLDAASKKGTRPTEYEQRMEIRGVRAYSSVLKRFRQRMVSLVASDPEIEAQLLRDENESTKCDLEAAQKLRKDNETKYVKEIHRLTELLDKSKRDMANEMESLKKDLAQCSQQLKEAHDKIFELQPHVQEPNPTAIEEEYTEICDSVEAWVERTLDPILDNPTQFRNICKAVSQDHELFAPFRSLMTANDLSAMEYENTDEHIVVAVIMRFLQREVWETSLHGMPQAIDFLKAIEESMGKLHPKRELATVRTWKNETYRALVSMDGVKNQKEDRSAELAYQLAYVLKVFTFLPSRKDFDSFVASVRSSLIEPAVALNEKMSLTSNFYWFNSCVDLENSPDQHDLIAQWMDHFNMTNILANGKKFGRKDLESGVDTKDQFKRHLRLICAKTPLLLYREVKGDTCLDEQILGKSRLVVAWSKGVKIDPSKKVAPGLLASLKTIERSGT